MRYICLIATVSLILGGLILAQSQSSRRTTQTPQTRATAQPLAIDRVVSTQQRINRYFHGDVISKLKRCWSSVKGKGAISLRYTYIKADEKWIFNRLEPDQSTLRTSQDAIAMKCMSDAVRGSSFPVDSVEDLQNTFVLHWTWPVPFPANAAQLTSAMFARVNNGATNGCDGLGAPAKCQNCLSLTCIKVCVGYNKCMVDAAGCLSEGYCASGGPFSVTGVAVIY